MLWRMLRRVTYFERILLLGKVLDVLKVFPFEVRGSVDNVF